MSAPTRVAAPTPASRETGPVLRRCACGGRAPVGGECEECRKKRLGLQRSASGATVSPGFAPPLVHDVLRSPGRPLDEGTRAFMEPRFRHSFADVRVHADGPADASAAAVSAQAYTMGRDVVFAAGRYAPGTVEGRRLIAHELAHVVQQSIVGSATPMAALEVGAVDAPEEREAERAADAVCAGGSAGALAGGAGAVVRRQDVIPVDLVPVSPEDSKKLKEQGVELPTVSDETWRDVSGVGAAAIGTVKIWINAFIPLNVPGVTSPAPGHPGETMLHGPIPGVSDCYLGDSRDFSNHVHASSRMHTEMKINLAGPTEMFQFNTCGTTYEIDCEDGDVECASTASARRMRFSNLRRTGGVVLVDVSAAANNPCQSGSPDIDYRGTFTIQPATRAVEFNGMLDQFPAFEGYATADDGAGVTLFQTSPSSGSTPANLFGDANRAQTGSATI